MQDSIRKTPEPKKECKALVSWVRFVNGEEDPLPPGFFRLAEPGYLKKVRDTATAILRKVAELNTEAMRGKQHQGRRSTQSKRKRRRFIPPPIPEPQALDIDLRVSVPVLVMTALSPGVITYRIQEDRGEMLLHALIGVLEEEGSRVRLCGCGKIFAALNRRRQFCSPACCQRGWYAGHTEYERKRKLKAYYENKKRNRQVRAARDEGVVWIDPEVKSTRGRRLS